MASLAYVVDQVRRRLEPDYLATVTALSQDVSADDQALLVDSVEGITDGGVVEIGSELMRVQSIDPDSNQVNLYPFGRGYNSTTPAVHLQGSMVVVEPDYPFSAIVDLMNSVVGELFSMGLTAVASIEQAYHYSTPFALPAGAITPIGVHIYDPVWSRWHQTYVWSHDPYSNQLVVNNVPDGYNVRVTYTTEPQPLDQDQPDADFYTLTGFDQRLADVVALGVAYRISSLRAAAKVNKMSAESSADAQAKPISEGRLLSQTLYAEYTQRVQAELNAQRNLYPISLHRTR